MKQLEKAVSKNVCASLNIPEHVRLQIRDKLRQELLEGELKIKPKEKRIDGILDNE